MKPTTPTPPSIPEVLEIERTFAAPADRVFAAFASYDAMAAWFGPEGCSVIAGHLDFQVGGTYLLRVTTDDIGEVEVTGTYTAIDHPRRIAFTWRWQGNPEANPSDSTVELTFTPHGDATRLHLRQVGIENDHSRHEHNLGWNGTFDRLERLLATG